MKTWGQGLMAVAVMMFMSIGIGVWTKRLDQKRQGAERANVPNYHPVTIADMIATDPANWSHAMHTHITVEGWLTYFANEADGDIHLRLCDAPTVQGVDRKHCIVAEIIPELPMKTADALILGKKLRVSGNYRYDAEMGCKQAKPSHCWHEVHPVRKLEVVQ